MISETRETEGRFGHRKNTVSQSNTAQPDPTGAPVCRPETDGGKRKQQEGLAKVAFLETSVLQNHVFSGAYFWATFFHFS